MTPPAKPEADDVAAIEARIVATREQLGRTVDQLSARLDVPSRTRETALRARDTVVETYRESPPLFIGAAAGLTGLLAGAIMWRRKRAHRRRKR